MADFMQIRTREDQDANIRLDFRRCGSDYWRIAKTCSFAGSGGP